MDDSNSAHDNSGLQNTPDTVSAKTALQPDTVRLVTPLTDLQGEHQSRRWDNQQPFVVHRHVLLKVPFFEVCLRSGCKESQTGVIYLNTGDAESFNILLRFLWTGQLKIDRGEDYCENHMIGRSYIRKLIKLYSFASFLVLELLMNATIDAAFEHSRTWSSGPETMNYLYKQNLEDSKLGDFMIRRKAESLRRDGRAALDTDMGRRFFSLHFLRSEDRAKRMLGALLDPPIAFQKTMDACQWHTHQQTPICPKIEGS